MDQFVSLRRLFFTLLCLLTITVASAQNQSSGAAFFDTLRRTSVKYSVYDSTKINLVKTVAEDSFSTIDFNALKGVTTFRGGPYRDHASIGNISGRPSSLSIKWTMNTQPKGEWGGGAGWTGQPSIVQWSDSVREIMNLKPEFIKTAGFTEVIFGSLDGHIYFVDLETGRPSRAAIDIKNPIKGSVTIDPRGFPILYCGQGIALAKDFGFRIFSLIDQQRIFYINGFDSFALRGWAAFDGAALINPKNDRMYLGGENGLFYALNLHTRFDPSKRSLSINPDVVKYRYKASEGHQQGIENSVAAWQNNIFFADNNGYIQSLDINTFQPHWTIYNHDDTDATIAVEPTGGVPYLYTGSEVDKQKDPGFSYLRKINGLTGETIWSREFPCLTVRGDHPVNGGLLATPVIGKHNENDRVIFNLSRYEQMNKGLLVALNKTTGATLFETKLKHYAWSSPVDIYDAQGNLFIFLADSKGYVMLIDGCDGTIIFEEKISELFEASPAVFDNKIVIPSRPNQLFCLEIK